MAEKSCPVCGTKTVFPQKSSPNCPHCMTPYLSDIPSSLDSFSWNFSKTEAIEKTPSPDNNVDSLTETEALDKNISQQKTLGISEIEEEMASSEAATIITHRKELNVSETEDNIKKTVGNGFNTITSQFVPGGYFGKYKILEKIAQGGMGAVFKVYHPLLQQKFALKVLLAGQDVNDQQLARFHQEAKSCSKMRHPHLVAVHDVGEVEGIHYLTMDFIEGKDLSHTLIAKEFSPKEVVLLIRKICEALVYSHGQHILHRDLKPANILVDVHGEPYVTDFGLAKDISKKDHLTQEGSILGTPAYMPPEQALGEIEKVGPPSDIYSLGAIFYEMLTQRCPISAGTSIELFHKIINEDPIPPRKFKTTIPKDLETICLKCLAKEPKNRYQTMQALLEDLTRYLEERPILARPSTPMERLWKLLKRHKKYSLTLLFFSLVLLITSFSFVWSQYQEKQKITEAYQRLQKLEKEQHQEKDVAVIRKQYQDLFQQIPEYPQARTQFSQFLIDRGYVQEAITCLKELLQHQPQFSQAHLLLATAYQKQNQSQESQKHLQQYRLQEAQIIGSATDIFLKASLATQQQEWEKAISLYSEVIKKDPKFLEARNNRAYVFWKNLNFSEAKADLDYVLERKPYLAAPLLNRARVFLSENKIDASEKDIQALLELNPSLSEAWVLYLQIQILRNDTHLAQKILQKGFQHCPDDPLLLQEQGKIFLANQQNLSAIESFQKALQKDPYLPEACYYIAKAHFEQEAWEHAFQVLAPIQDQIPQYSISVQKLWALLQAQLGYTEGYVWLKNFLEQMSTLENNIFEEKECILLMQQSLYYGDYVLLSILSEPLLDEYQYHTSANAYLGLHARYSGREEEAQAFWKRAEMGCYKKNTETIWLSRFYFEQQEWERAKNLLFGILEKFSENTPETLKAQHLLFAIYLAQKKWDEMYKLLPNLEPLPNPPHEFICLLGTFYFKQENASGQEYLKKASQTKFLTEKLRYGLMLKELDQIELGLQQFTPPWKHYEPEFALLYAYFKMQSNQEQEAEKILQQLLQKNPAHFEALLLQISLCLRLQQKEQANSFFQRAENLRMNEPRLKALAQELK